MSAARTWPAVRASLLVLAVATLALTLTHRAPRGTARAEDRDRGRAPQRTGRAGAGRNALDSRSVDATRRQPRTGHVLQRRPNRRDRRGPLRRLGGSGHRRRKLGRLDRLEPAVLVCLGALFVLMLAVIPLSAGAQPGHRRRSGGDPGLVLFPAALRRRERDRRPSASATSPAAVRGAAWRRARPRAIAAVVRLRHRRLSRGTACAGFAS